MPESPATDTSMATPDPADLELALEMADAADAISMEHYGASDLIVRTKPDHTPVTEADQAVEKRLRDLLAERRPEDRVIGEEFGGATSGEVPADRTWVLDPIDATKNYMRRVPVWSSLIALLVDGVPRVGVVSAPALGRRWWTQTGTGAWVSEPGNPARRLAPSGVTRISDASFSYSDRVGWAEEGALQGFEKLVAECWRTRAFGDYWSHMLVAEGAVDIGAEVGLKIWDMAALVAIVREAGGAATSFDGSDPLLGDCLVTTNGVLHDAVLDTLRGQRRSG